MTIQAQITGGVTPLTVAPQFLITNPDGSLVTINLQPLTDPDGDGLFTAVFADLPPGILPPGEFELPGYSILAIAAAGNVAHWPQIDIRQ